MYVGGEQAEQPHLMDSSMRSSTEPRMQHHAICDDDSEDETFYSVYEGSVQGQNPPPPMHQPMQQPIPPGQPLPHGIGQQSRAFPSTASSSELRNSRATEVLERLGLLRAVTMPMPEIARHQSSSYDDSELHAGSRVSADKQRQADDDVAAAETAAAASTPPDHPMFPPC